MSALQDDRVMVWFDIDNTLYSASTKISHAMGERIHGWFLQCCDTHPLINHPLAYFVSLGLAHDEAADLHHHYYTEYGLALRGLTRHHDVGNSIPHLSVPCT